MSIETVENRILDETTVAEQKRKKRKFTSFVYLVDVEYFELEALL